MNAFGFGGINAHANPGRVHSQRARGRIPSGGPPWDSEAVILRAASRERLLETCRRLENVLTRTGSASPDLCDLAHSVNCKEESSAEPGVCLAIVASSLEDLSRKLAHSAARLAGPACRNINDVSGIYFFERMLAREGKVAFLFPGEGSQDLNMVAELCLRLAPVRAAI